jgi:hypothetical protein
MAKKLIYKLEFLDDDDAPDLYVEKLEDAIDVINSELGDDPPFNPEHYNLLEDNIITVKFTLVLMEESELENQPSWYDLR